MNIIPIKKASVVLDDQLAETVYDPKSRTTKYAIFKNEKVAYYESLEIDSKKYLPLSPDSDFISKRIILFPSIAMDYGTTNDLIDDIRAYIHKYVDISDTFEGLLPYYVLLSWVYERFHEIPYMRAIGDYGSGKTRFLKVVGSVCYKPIFTGGATTTAPIFRILDEIKGTLILDEADLRASDMTNDIVKILNMGYAQGGSVMRMGGKDYSEMRAFDVFSPKIIATRETFNDKALESRFLIEEMNKSILRKDIPRNLHKGFETEALDLRNKLLMWRFRNFRKDTQYIEPVLENIHPRLYQIIVPLMEIMDDESQKDSLKKLVTKLNADIVAEQGQSIEAEVLIAILELAENTSQNTLLIGEITNQYNKDISESYEKASARKIGWIVSKKIKLKSVKTRNGFAIDLERNKDRINDLKNRFGLSKDGPENELVNNVNYVETPTALATNTQNHER